MYSIEYIDNNLNTGTLIRFSKDDSLEYAICVLKDLAQKWNMTFKSDSSLFGGYYVRPDGICYTIK